MEHLLSVFHCLHYFSFHLHTFFFVSYICTVFYILKDKAAIASRNSISKQSLPTEGCTERCHWFELQKAVTKPVTVVTE